MTWKHLQRGVTTDDDVMNCVTESIASPLNEILSHGAGRFDVQTGDVVQMLKLMMMHDDVHLFYFCCHDGLSPFCARRCPPLAEVVKRLLQRTDLGSRKPRPYLCLPCPFYHESACHRMSASYSKMAVYRSGREAERQKELQ